MHAAAQHRPRPLPLFLDLLRSETAADPARLAAALAGLRAYQQAPRPAPPPPRPVVARAGRAALRDYGGGGRPVVVVPSLINSPAVLDLSPGNSFMDRLAEQGLHPLLVDWGTPAAADRGIGIGGHVETLLLPMLRDIGADAALVGYCLGGTMAIAAARSHRVAGLALIATPWRFAGYPSSSRIALDEAWRTAAPTIDALGLLPLEFLQTIFWRLDPARTVAKFVRFGRLDPASDQAAGFVALEDWANDGPPLTHAAGRDLIEDLMRDDLPGGGRWCVTGIAIDPAALTCPVLDIVSTTDRIVPMTTAAGVGQRLELALGHVGMIVGSRARDALWNPLAHWLVEIGT